MNDADGSGWSGWGEFGMVDADLVLLCVQIRFEYGVVLLL